MSGLRNWYLNLANKENAKIHVVLFIELFKWNLFFEDDVSYSVGYKMRTSIYVIFKTVHLKQLITVQWVHKNNYIWGWYKILMQYVNV